MSLSKLIPAITLLFFVQHSRAQMEDITEKKPVLVNGIEYGYTVRNEQTKEAKGEEFSRFEITLYATNKSGCTRLFANSTYSLSSEANNILATFDCTNANGKRLTSKTGTVRARDFNVSVKVKNKDDKEVSQSVKAGYIFRDGETLRSNIIVLVPLGQKPTLTFTANNPSELR